MNWFRKNKRKHDNGEPEQRIDGPDYQGDVPDEWVDVPEYPGDPTELNGDERAAQAAAELMDRFHHRASVTQGDTITVDPAQVLDNICAGMDRLDLDITVEVALGDFASYDELAVLMTTMHAGETLAVVVVNHALKIQLARYPHELVRTPFPDGYDLRQLYPGLRFADQPLAIAKTIFNQRIESPRDLDVDDVREPLAGCSQSDQVQVFQALFFMYGSKIGAMKTRLGMDR